MTDKTMHAELNGLLLRLESLLLNEQPCLVGGAAFDEMAALGVGDTMAYALLLASAFGLRPDENERDRTLVYDLLLPSIQCLSVEDFASNAYYSHIVLPEAQQGSVRLTYMQYDAFQAFPCGDLQVKNGRLRAPLGFFKQPFRYPAITHDGREWMTVTPNEIRTMQQALDAARGHVLVYGLGLGYFAYMASLKDAVESVTVFEIDDAVFTLFSKHIFPQFGNGKVMVQTGDAFAHAEQSHFLRYGRPYDVVFTDLWHDAGDGIPLYQRMRALQQRYAAPHQEFHYWIEPSMRYYLEA